MSTSDAKLTAERKSVSSGVTGTPTGSVIPDSSEAVAVSRAVISQARGGTPLVLVRRTVTEWREVDLNA